MKDLRVVFMGTPDFAVPVLEKLILNTKVVLVVSQPDKCVGRKRELVPTPIKKKALEYNIPVFQPEKVKLDYEEIILARPDIIITCAYGQIIPKVLLDLPRLGCINVHASLLPYLRGGAPLHHAIIDGYKETGVTIMYMDESMDTGDIISTVTYPLKDTDTVGTVHDNLMEMGANLLMETLPSIIKGTNKRIKQDNSKATYAYNISRSDEHLDFSGSGLLVERKVRGLNPWPLANTLFDDEEIKIISGYFVLGKSIPKKINVVTKDSLGIGCSDGIYYVTALKPSGKKVMDIKSYLNGMDKDKLLAKKIS
mgnify:FL=1